MAEIKPVTVHIMGNEYHVSSPDEQVSKLEDAAKDLDRRMREIKAGGRIVGVERIAVMAALNMAYELREGESGDFESAKNVSKRIKKLQQDIDSVLASDAQMELT
ncbi:cell division protein ZapA [Aliikangiella coralliicola]|uniref:Cell division protein ZapA n=1 Tax=Aliikangiella coralliicola TaxID=2592383 RepID=A0A545UIA0_9GAMM|nr:cell division protein ZapA [Aliikangiella coralliicola]TQV89188.1 cell division protein ZapA [Aliikangiella coralliicola]